MWHRVPDLTREAGSGDDRYYHLVLLAENNQGYSNLMKIVSKGFVEGFYYKPRVDLELLEEYHEGIIALKRLPGRRGGRDISQEGCMRMPKRLRFGIRIFSERGISFWNCRIMAFRSSRMVNQQLLQMHQETGIDLVATNDVHYTYAEDAEPHDILLCLQTGKKLADEDRMRYEGGQYYVKSPEEMEQSVSLCAGGAGKYTQDRTEMSCGD